MGQDPPSCHDVWAVLFSNAGRQAQSSSFTSHCRLRSTGETKKDLVGSPDAPRISSRGAEFKLVIYNFTLSVLNSLKTHPGVAGSSTRVSVCFCERLERLSDRSSWL